jgi:predicted enzyme related to lactoylglutathione lyase
MNTPINPVGYVELHTSDPARATAFYTELLAWRAEEENTPMGRYTLFQGILAGLKQAEDGIAPGWLPYINVPDVVAATQRLRTLGGTVLRDCVTIPEGTFSVLRDPTGAQVGLFQSNKR